MKVLIADDEPVSRRLLASSLERWGYEVVVAADGLEALELLQLPDAPNLVVLDWLMPGMDGVELCREIRRQKEEPYTYIILLTAKRTQADIVEGLENGADDYLTKPFHAQELKVRLQTGKRILCLMEQLLQARAALRELAMHDGLTDLWNRAAILESLDAELDRARRQGASLGLVMFDLDHFKAINDTYGHLAGDEVLRAAAKAIRDTLRPYDSVGRYGGEEFLLILPGCDERNAVCHAERLRLVLSELHVPATRDEIRVTASFGVAVAGPGAEADASGLIQAADSALYRAKRAGRNRVELAHMAHLVSA
jgi:diguanylate cyclase (GGDEF)-like protein